MNKTRWANETVGKQLYFALFPLLFGHQNSVLGFCEQKYSNTRKQNLQANWFDLHASFWCKRVEEPQESLIWEPFPRYSEIIKIAILGYFFLKRFTEVAYGHFLPRRGWNWAYFRSTDSGFRDMGLFSKLPYLGMEPWIWKRARSNLDPLSTPGGEIGLIFAL